MCGCVCVCVSLSASESMSVSVSLSLFVSVFVSVFEHHRFQRVWSQVSSGQLIDLDLVDPTMGA